MPDKDEVLVYGARYATMEDALDDLVRIKGLHDEHHLGRYDAAVVAKEDDGRIVVENTDATERGGGAWMGAIAGGLIGAVFPPAFVASAAVGAGVGAAGGNAAKRFSRRDAKELADQLLEPGQTGLLLVTDWLEEAYRSTLFAKSVSERSITVSGDADLRRALEETTGATLRK